MRNFLNLLILSALILAGCQSARQREQKYEPAPTHKEEILQAENSPSPSPKIWQKASQPRVAVVLGPGGAKAFAHVGVLKQLVQNKVPIEKVVGLEWGALVGGLYAIKGQIHEVEWKLYKMEQKDWLPKKGLFNSQSNGSSINSMNDFLKDSFGNEDLSTFRVPFACTSRSLWTATLVMQTKGTARDVMKKCLPFPPLFQVRGSFIGAPSNTKNVVKALKEEGFTVVILVDVLGSAVPVPQDALMDYSTHVILWQEVRREMLEARAFATDVIDINTSSYPMAAFESRKDLVELGESLGKSPVNSIVNRYGF